MALNSRALWQATSRCRLIVLFALLSGLVFFVHLQDFVPISRFQHYGVVSIVFGIGWLLEIAVSFRRLRRWALTSYISTCIFFLTVGLVYLNNSWIGHRSFAQTAETESTERFLKVSYVVFCIYLAAVWAIWIREEIKTGQARTGDGGATRADLIESA